MLTIIHGKDSLRSRLALRDILAKGSAAAEFLDDANAFDELRVFFETAPLFGGDALFVVEGGVTGDTGERFASYSRLPSLCSDPRVRVVLYESSDVSARVAFKALAPHADVMPFNILPPAQSISWLANVYKESSAMSPAIVKEVYARCQGDLWSAYNELAKLSAYCADAKATIADIDALDIGTPTANIFSVIDGFFTGSAASSFERLQLLWQEGQSPLGVFALMERQLRVTAIVKEAVEQNAAPATIAKAAGIPPFALSRATATSRRMSWVKIKGLYARVESLDEKMKRGAIDPYFAVELFASAVVA